MPSPLPFDRPSGSDRASGAAASAPVVLVAEDDPHLLRLITQGFTRAGYAAFAASDGCAALQMVKALGPDLLVTDIVMPQKEGLATIIEAQRAAPAMGVIAISGGGCYGRTGNFLQWAQELGADQALAKPFALSELLAVARDVLERRGAPLPSAVARRIP